jgi:hypothetical protein
MGEVRDTALRANLPNLQSEYSFDSLSEAETGALEEALGDGFGDVGSDGYQPMPLPTAVRSGLTAHRFFVWDSRRYDHEEYPAIFWDWRDDRPPPSEDFPLGFVIRQLKIYFANQIDRFCVQVVRDDPGYGLLERDVLEAIASDRLYAKPWYEFHATQFITWMEPQTWRTEEQRDLPLIFAASWSGKLGRLVEQYYWKFRFEKSTMTGLASRQAASTGGKAKARTVLVEHAAWQCAATEILASRPGLSKTAVATAVRNRLGVQKTAKHIARVIRHPEKLAHLPASCA